MEVGDLVQHKLNGQVYIVAEMPLGPDAAQNMIGIINQCELRWIHCAFLRLV